MLHEITIKTLGELVVVFRNAEEYQVKKDLFPIKPSYVAVNANNFKVVDWPLDSNACYPVKVFQPLNP